jgi:hypothetical protein
MMVPKTFDACPCGVGSAVFAIAPPQSVAPPSAHHTPEPGGVIAAGIAPLNGFVGLPVND